MSNDMERAAFDLWRLLDDIDTLDDACRDNDKAFRGQVRELQRRRFQHLSGDAYDALWRKFRGETA